MNRTINKLVDKVVSMEPDDLIPLCVWLGFIGLLGFAVFVFSAVELVRAVLS